MKILLIKPPYTRLRGTGQIPYFPLGIGYIAAMLEKNGFEVGIYNVENPRNPNEIVLRDQKDVFHYRSQAHHNYISTIKNPEHFVWKEVMETLRMFKPDAVGISLLSVEYASALQITKICKEYNNDMKVIWGGFHPSFMPEASLHNQEVDLIVAGEGEITVVELFKALATEGDLAKISGLYLRKADNSVYFTGHREIIPSLDSIPLPARHLRLYPESYDRIWMGNILTSRGCPFRCTFCGCRNLWEKKFRQRSPESVIGEIGELVKNYQTNHVFFMDDTFGLTKEKGIELCNKIRHSKLNIVWTSGTRVDRVDDELIHHMKKAGCVYIDLGIETGSEKMSRIIKKDITNDDVRKAIKVINRHGIATGAFFMAGFPEETFEDLEMTFNLIKECNTTHISFNIWDPMPGSDLYYQAIDLGAVPKDADWCNFPLWPDKHFAIQMDPQGFDKKAKEMADWIYCYNNSFSSRLRKVKPKVLALLSRDPKFLLFRTLHYIKDRFQRQRSKMISGDH